MTELRQTALAYYRNAPIQIHRWVNELFSEMDEDGNEKVSLQEYLAYMDMYEDCKHLSTPRFFDELKQEGSEDLELLDVLTLVYVVYSGRPFCNGRCKNLIKGGYFACVKCFDDHSTKDTFNVCTDCYVDGKYVHGHGPNYFLDNFLLLQTITKRGMGAKLNQHQEASSIVTKLETLESGSGSTPVETGNSSSCSCSLKSTSAETSKSSSSSSGTLTPGISSGSGKSNAVVPVNPRPNNRGRKALKTVEILLALGNIFAASTQCTIM